MASEVPADRLPDYFPKLKGCTEVAGPFFKCFEDNSKMLSNDDADAGVRGLSKCLVEKAAYEKCMSAQLRTKDIKKYRVQEEYRKSD